MRRSLVLVLDLPISPMTAKSADILIDHLIFFKKKNLVDVSMGGVTGGDAGDVSHPVRNFGGLSPKRSQFVKKIFGIFANSFGFSNISKIKWAKSEQKSEFGERRF